MCTAKIPPRPRLFLLAALMLGMSLVFYLFSILSA